MTCSESRCNTYLRRGSAKCVLMETDGTQIFLSSLDPGEMLKKNVHVDVPVASLNPTFMFNPIHYALVSGILP